MFSFSSLITTIIMEGKKISFGFLKTKKVDKPVAEEKKEFIECMEEKSLKIVGGEEVKEAAPLVIPMKPNTLVTAERLKQIADEVESALNEPEELNKPISPVQCIKTENESLDQMVVRELLEDTKKEVKIETPELTVPVSKNPVVEVQKESTLEDYEDVPIQEFGLAMLRGMGWTPSKEQSKYKQPQLRPKGLGLGADKVVKEKQRKKGLVNEKGEELTIVNNSFVKITAGKYSGYYGKVVSLDEDNGRVMVDITMKKETVSLSEFMMQPVTKAEFNKESKVLNADSFEDYKRSEKISQKPSKNNSEKAQDEASSSRQSQDLSAKDHRADRSKSNHSSRPDDGNSSGVHSRDRSRRNSSSTEEKSHRRKKSKKRYSSCDSLSSLSESDKKHKHKSSRRRYSSDSDSDSPKREKRKRTPVKKRDIDKKRKGKKKKRDRDRSPHHYKKHRK